MSDSDAIVKSVVEHIDKEVQNGNVKEGLGVTLNREIKYSFEIFNKRIDGAEQDESLICSIHSVYSSDVKHNCLGCNLDDLTWQISHFLKESADKDISKIKIHHFYSMYFLLLNEVWERIIQILYVEYSLEDGAR